MSKMPIAVVCVALCPVMAAVAQQPFEKDILQTSAGDLEITFLGHGSLMFAFNDKIIHIDPYGEVAEYAALPKADLVFLTHHHRDHLDPNALRQVRTPHTTIILTETCARSVDGGIVMKNGDVRTVAGIRVEAVAAYNLVHKRDNGQPFHPPGEGNGYVLNFGGTRVYIAGDTENIPEMKALKGIDCAFLPMNLPYTMTPEMAADAAAAFKPKVLYPYHFGETDTAQLTALLKNHPEIEVRIRRMK
jgi:L-ascorbate metabolism protein UlaG (beta-lactamase superfamily)